MRRLVLTALALLAGTVAASASAFTLGAGVFSPASCSPDCAGSFGAGLETGAINDTFAFDVATGVLLHTANATNSSVVPGEEILGFVIKLFSGTPTGPNSFIAAGLGGITTASEQTTGALPDEALNPGSYFLQILGTDQGTRTDYAGSFSFAPVQTPLPATLLLFGSGLGLIAAGARRKKA